MKSVVLKKLDERVLDEFSSFNVGRLKPGARSNVRKSGRRAVLPIDVVSSNASTLRGVERNIERSRLVAMKMANTGCDHDELIQTLERLDPLAVRNSIGHLYEWLCEWEKGKFPFNVCGAPNFAYVLDRHGLILVIRFELGGPGWRFYIREPFEEDEENKASGRVSVPHNSVICVRRKVRPQDLGIASKLMLAGYGL